MIKIATQTASGTQLLPLEGSKIRANSSWISIKSIDKIYLNGLWYTIGNETQARKVRVSMAGGENSGSNGQYEEYIAEGVPTTGNGKLYRQTFGIDKPSTYVPEKDVAYWLQKRNGKWAMVVTSGYGVIPDVPESSDDNMVGAIYIQAQSVVDTGDVPYLPDGYSCEWYDCSTSSPAALQVIKAD